MTATFPKAVLVYGSGSGLGKSTLGRALVERLYAQGLSARFVGEEETLSLPAFRERRFAAEIRSEASEVAVVDSMLPCWDWLYSAGCSDEEVRAFSLALADVLSPLNPVIVFVEGDLDSALSRAISDRGLGWALDLAELRTGRRDLGALRLYFRLLRAGAKRMLVVWPHRVVRVDTLALDLWSCVEETVFAIGPRANG